MTKLNIKRTAPPFYWIIRFFFPSANLETTCFVFGSVIYCRYDLPPDLLAHELTHVKQQKSSFWCGIVWWVKYIASPKFRLSQEVEAYQNQFKYAVENYDRNQTDYLLRRISSDLSGPLYNNLIDFQTAREAIRGHINP